MKILSNSEYKAISRYEEQLKTERSKNAVLTISIQRQSKAFEVVSLVAFMCIVVIAAYIWHRTN